MMRALATAVSTTCLIGFLFAIGWAAPSPYTGGGTAGDPGASNPRAPTSWTIRVTKDGASVGAGYCGLAVYGAIGGEPCDAPVVCENPGAPNFICASGQIACSATDSAADLAAALATGLNAECAGAVTAVANGDLLALTAAASGAESCVFSSEIGTVAGFALGLNVGEIEAATCEARNVCDGTASNEAAGASGGFSFREDATVDVPAVGPISTWLVCVLLALAGFASLRRRDVKVVAAIAALALVAVASDPASARTRKRASTLTPAEKQEYVDALKGMKSQGTYDPLVTLHAGLPSPAFPHSTGGILAWHREYLLRMENAMRAVKPNVTIPYWEWSRDGFPASKNLPVGGFPPSFDYDFLGGNGQPSLVLTGPFALSANWSIASGLNCSPPDLRRSFNGSLPSSLTTTFLPLVHPTITSFTSGVLQPHNDVHVWVRGQMQTFCSPADPVFWMHHAMVDRLWCLWQRYHPQVPHYSPSAGEPSLNGFMPYFTPSAAPASTLNMGTHGAGYRYDDCGCLPAPPSMIMWLADCTAHDRMRFHTATWHGAPECVPGGKVGQALHFASANSDWLSVASKLPTNSGTGNFSVDLWIKPASVSGVQPLLEKLNADAGWALYIENGLLCSRLRSGGVTRTFCDGTVVAGSWQFVAAVFTRGAPEKVTLTVNANEYSGLLGLTALGSITTPAQLRIGSRAAPFTTYDGFMDEIEVYTRKLDPRLEVREIYLADSFGKCPLRPSRPDDATQCRDAVTKAGETLVAGILKATTKCHQVVQSTGSPPVDCNDVDQLPSAEVAKVRAKVTQTITGKCTSIPPSPSEAGYYSCPAPCGGTPIADFDALASCVLCLGESTVASASDHALGTPRGRARPTPERRCHATLSRVHAKYVKTVLKQMNKCQKAAEKDDADTTTGCEDPAADPKILAARAKGEAKIAAACTGVDLSGVDSCTPFPACVFESDADAARTLFQRLHLLDAAPSCGNGIVEDGGGEICDTRGDTATCDGDCTTPQCGDGLLNYAAGETCDDGGAVAGDGCSPTCEIETYCYCDGPTGTSTFCHPRSADPSLTCTFQETCVCPTCGDGTVDAPVEQCDDAGESASCNADCTFATCGDGRMNASAGEACDGEVGVGGIPPGPGLPCLGGCVLNACGDGDACTDHACRTGPGEGPEQCDDGNLVDGDGCSSECARENACGNDVAEGDIGEECDGMADAACPGACGAPAMPFACRCPTGATCSGDPVAGDGILGGTCADGGEVGQPCDEDGPGSTSHQCIH